MKLVQQIVQQWQKRLAIECPDDPESTHESIIFWLMGEDPDRLESLSPAQLAVAEQAMDFRYRILRHRYLGVSPAQAYKKLIQRLGSLVVLRQKIRTWVALSRDRQRTVVDVLQEVIQEMLQSDRYMQQQMAWISQCSDDHRLRNILLLSATEEYCLRPIRNQPLLVYRFVNYLRRTQRGGLTQVPAAEMIRLISEEIAPSETDGPVSLLDLQAISSYQEEQATEEQQRLRNSVAGEFERYLAETVEPLAAQWLRLYLQGRSQDEIARELKVPVNQIYRLREKISYHALKVFAIKIEPTLVSNWLEISINEHSLGLTPMQWQQYCAELSPQQKQILDLLKAGQSVDSIAGTLKMKANQVIGEWSKLYITAQNMRNAS